MSRYPINIDTSEWGAFDPKSLTDLMCERERTAFTHYTLTRLKKQAKTGSDDQAILVGALMAIVQIAFASHGNEPQDHVRDSLHQAIDFCWLQVEAVAADDRRPQ